MMHPRLKRAFEQHASALTAAAPLWESSAEEVFNRLAATDPSDKPAFGHGKKLHLPWLLKQLSTNTLTPDNLADTHLALRIFCADPQAGDLGRYKTPAQLIEAVLTPKRNLIREYLSHGSSSIQHDRWQSLHGFPAAPAQRADFVLERLIETDPTGGRHLPHLLRWLTAPQPLLPEDLPRMQRELRLYTKHRQQIMPAEKRDLAGCENAHDFYGLLKPFKPKLNVSTSAYESAEDRTLASNEATLLLETDDFRLLRINTKKAAQLLGKNTEWCTAYGDGDGRDNRFEQYSDNLIYMRSKKQNAIFQFHFGEWMLNDAEDNEIRNIPAFLKDHPGLKELFEPYVAEHLPGQLQNAYSNSLDMRVPSLLAIGKIYPNAQTIIAYELPPVLMNAAVGNSPEFVTKVLEWSEDYPSYQTAIAPHVGHILEAAFAHAASDTDYESQFDLFLTAQLKPEHKAIADAVAPRLLPEFVQAAGEFGHPAFLSRVMVLERDDPAYAPLLRAAVPTAIKASLSEAAERQRPIREFIPLLRNSQSDPVYKAACLEALDTVLDYALSIHAANFLGTMKVDFIRLCSGDSDYRAALEAAEERQVRRPKAVTLPKSSPK